MSSTTRDKVLTVRVNEAEKYMLKLIAEDYSMGTSEVIRMLIRGEHKILKQLKK